MYADITSLTTWLNIKLTYIARQETKKVWTFDVMSDAERKRISGYIIIKNNNNNNNCKISMLPVSLLSIIYGIELNLLMHTVYSYSSSLLDFSW